MNKIDSKGSLIRWSESVNHANTKRICDLQDDFSYTDIAELKGYFKELNQNEKELCIFSISKAMGSSILMEFVKSIARSNANDFIEAESKEINDRWNKVLAAETDFRAMKEKLERNITNLEKQNTVLHAENQKHIKQNSDYYRRILDLENELEENEKTITELRAFESHIKDLLNK